MGSRSSLSHPRRPVRRCRSRPTCSTRTPTLTGCGNRAGPSTPLTPSIPHSTNAGCGSRFEPADQYTVKLEGAAIAGYQTISFVGIRDPQILESIGEWTKTLEAFLVDRIEAVLGLAAHDYSLELRCYGWNAVLGALDTDDRTPREVGAVLIVTAPTQAVATSIAKYANPYLLHMPLAGMTHLPSFAFMTSPAEIERGAVYEFVLNHSVEVSRPDELIRTRTEVIR
jgi:hypothetical protein